MPPNCIRVDQTVTAVFKWVRGLSVGVKLTVTLVMVVLFTAGVLSVIENQYTARYLDLFAQNRLHNLFSQVFREVSYATSRKMPPAGALAHARAELKGDLPPEALVYGLTPEGQTVLPQGEKGGRLPEGFTLLHLVRLGQGVMAQEMGGHKQWLQYQRLGDGSLVVVVQASQGLLVEPALMEGYHLIAYAVLVLIAVVGVFAVWLSRAVLANPLLRLTDQAERVAAGDLTPPEPLAKRRDELGRLSRALHQMTATAREMVDEARASQASFRQLFTDSRDATIIINEEGRIEDVNPAGLRMFGFQGREAMMALSDTSSLFAVPAERQHYLGLLAEQGFVKDYPATMRRRDGSVLEAQITATMRGTTAHFALVRDVTQMRAAQRALLESEERYRRLIENAPDIIFRWSLVEKSFDYISPAVEAITGYVPHEMMLNPDVVRQSIHPLFIKSLASHWRLLASGEGETAREIEYQIVHRSGETRWLRERAVTVRDHKGRPIAVEGLATDITEQKTVEQALVRGQVMVESTLQGLPVAVMVIDREHKVVHWNQAMERLTGVKAEEVVGTTRTWHPFYPEPRPVLVDLIVDMDWDGIKHYYGDMELKRSPLIGGGLECEGFFKGLGGSDRQLYFLAAPILDQDNRVVRAIETLVDLSDKRRLEEELRRLSVTDDLTGLYNQRFFYATLAREVESARRYGHQLSLLLLDLDHFKSYNDSYGHLEGDKVLSACAKAVQGQVRATDLACRYGGEEFVVLLPHTPLDEALKVAERIRGAVERLEFFPVLPEKGLTTASMTLSIGVAIHRGAQNSQDLVRRADHAMYEAKAAGRNRVAVYLKGGGIEVLERGSSEAARALA